MSNSNQYATIISTVSELRSDLEKAMTRMKDLEDQNSALSRINEVIKEDLSETKRRYVEARDNYTNILSEKVDADKRNESFIDRFLKFVIIIVNICTG